MQGFSFSFGTSTEIRIQKNPLLMTPQLGNSPLTEKRGFSTSNLLAQKNTKAPLVNVWNGIGRWSEKIYLTIWLLSKRNLWMKWVSSCYFTLLNFRENRLWKITHVSQLDHLYQWSSWIEFCDTRPSFLWQSRCSPWKGIPSCLCFLISCFICCITIPWLFQEGQWTSKNSPLMDIQWMALFIDLMLSVLCCEQEGSRKEETHQLWRRNLKKKEPERRELWA